MEPVKNYTNKGGLQTVQKILYPITNFLILACVKKYIVYTKLNYF